jgi:hypothetical protein
MIGAGSVFAQDPIEDPARSGARLGDWGLAVTPYGWFEAQSTDVGTKELSQSFNDLASIVNVGFQSRVVARWRSLVFAGDWTYADLGNTQQVGRVTVTHGIRQSVLDMKVGDEAVEQTVTVVGPCVGLSLGIF